jgi:hypothetical protein
MSREHDQALVVEVRQVDHAEAGRLTASGGLELVPEAAHGLVAMVAVGDVDALVGQDLLEPGAGRGIGDPPELVVDSVPLDVERRGSERGLDRSLPATIGIREHPKHQLEVGVASPHQRQAILLGAGEGPLVGQHRSGAEAGQLDQADEALAHVGPALGLEALVIDVKARLAVTNQRLGLQASELGRAGFVLGVGIARARSFGQDHAHAVVRRSSRERCPLLVVDHVVGRREQIAGVTGLAEVVAQTLERTNRGHGPCPIPRPPP